jgi:chemotaxis protein MotB
MSKRGGHEEHDAGMERWLLTYADMITLLLALFIVLWSISSVNISKFNELKQSLHDALNGKIVTGSQSILTGGPSPLNPLGTQVPTIQPQSLNIRASITQAISTALAKQDVDNLKRVQQQIQSYSQSHGLSGQIRTSIDERGLVVRILTDKVLFDSGEATLKAGSIPLLEHVAHLLSLQGISNNVRVEGNTDNQPISTAQFHSNWDLSAARATAVLDELLASGVQPKRLSVSGYGAERPIATNSTYGGRALNRRVDIVVLRRSTSGA